MTAGPDPQPTDPRLPANRLLVGLEVFHNAAWRRVTRVRRPDGGGLELCLEPGSGGNTATILTYPDELAGAVIFPWRAPETEAGDLTGAALAVAVLEDILAEVALPPELRMRALAAMVRLDPVAGFRLGERLARGPVR